MFSYKGGFYMLGLMPKRYNEVVNNNSLLSSIENFFNDDFFNMPAFTSSEFRMDVKENDNVYTVEAELPGINKEDITLDYNNGTLYIAVNHNEEINKEDGGYIHKERRSSSMQRGIYLGDIDVEGIEAKLENGILKVTAPKLAVSPNRFKIEVK